MSQPYEIFGSQDLKDDDGPVIDSLFIETDAPPNLKDATEPIPDNSDNIPPRKTTRLLTGSQILGTDWAPHRLLPADANRQGINIKVYSPTSVATDGVRFASENGSIYTAGKILHGGSTTFDNHTGEIWVVPCGNASGLASAPIGIEYWSVTE